MRARRAAGRDESSGSALSKSEFRRALIPALACEWRATANPERTAGPAGDLYIFLEVKEHAFFERRGADLYCTIPVSLAQASLGDTIKVPTLSGEEELEIPEGTQSGQIFRKKSKGLPNPHGGRGDLYVSVRVEIPAKLNREQRRLLEQLGQMMKVENKPAERSSNFFDKVKDIFG